MHTVTLTPPLDSVPTSCFAVPPPRVGHTMIRPRMKEMATQTEMASNDPRHGLDTATRWADKAGYDLEPAQTVQAEISAQLLHHIRLNPDSAQEPLIILNGISQAGVYRFFDGHGWRARMEDGARVWECKSPSQLHKLLRLDNMSKLALGPCRLHVRGSEAHGHRLLMACPPFTAVHAQAEWQDRAAPVVQDLRVPGHDGPHPPTRMLILQRSPENDGAVCAECATGDERAPVATEPILLQDAGAAGEGVAGGDASGGSHCPAAGSQGESCCGGGGIRGVRGPRRLTAQQKWARVALRMRRSDLRGSIRCVVSESGSGGSRVVADGVDRCQKIACLRSGRELVEVSRRLHSLEATFEVMVDTRVRYAVNARDAGQAELVRELQARLEHLQQRVWKVDHVRVKTSDFAELHRQHQEAVAENVRLKMQVSSLERKLVLLDRKAVEATSACRKASESLDRKRRGDVAERSQARMRTLRMRAPLL